MPTCPICNKWYPNRAFGDHMSEFHGWDTGMIEEYVYPEYFEPSSTPPLQDQEKTT